MEGWTDVLQVKLPMAHAIGQLAILLTVLVLMLHRANQAVGYFAESLFSRIQRRLLKRGQSLATSEI